MDKKSLTERDICTKFILPAVERSGWDKLLQIREEVFFTAGRIIVRGKLVTRGKGKKADFVLYYKPNIPIAIIEAKDNSHSAGDGMQQGLEYAATLDIPFVFSSNGDGFVFHDRTGTAETIETTLGLDAFPSPAELWGRYRASKGFSPEAEKIVLQDYFDDGSKKSPRYYQVNAINATIEAIAKGRDRVLLVMATGTGKTYTAFQIIWRLWKSGRKKRILFLADRNVLIDQTMVNDFRPFRAAMAKLSTNSKTIERSDGTKVDLTLALDKKRRIDTAFEIYLGLYQAITGPEEHQKLFKEFSRDFFDLIVIDECHRGSAADDSAWREILTHFSSATQIGLTATPKETEYASNIDYFGPPAFTYSLRQGISDGFLAPYKVIKVHIDIDVQGYRPEKGQLDRDGNEVEDRIYNVKDFDRNIVIAFGGREEDGIENNYPTFRTKETADLFLALIVRLLKKDGRAAVVLPDGTLFGEGIKTRLKEHLMEECNLHTIVRLPNSVFKPYASIGTNLLFFEKGTPTKDVWFYEHRVPEGQKAYSMTKPIRLEHFQGCIDWWGGAKRKGREETPQAWKVSVEDIEARGYNLDIKNPHTIADDHGDPETLLEDLSAAEAETANLRNQLKAILAEALAR